MQNETTLMGELVIVLKESLRKQAFSTVLLVCACAFLWSIRTEDKQELISQITILKSEIRDCSSARESQAVEIATLKASITLLQLRK